jgi:hypothetical protein
MNKKPEVKIHVQTTTYTDVVRIEIEISGADAAARDLAEAAIKMAIDSLEE